MPQAVNSDLSEAKRRLATDSKAKGVSPGNVTNEEKHRAPSKRERFNYFATSKEILLRFRFLLQHQVLGYRCTVTDSVNSTLFVWV